MFTNVFYFGWKTHILHVYRTRPGSDGPVGTCRELGVAFGHQLLQNNNLWELVRQQAETLLQGVHLWSAWQLWSSYPHRAGIRTMWYHSLVNKVCWEAENMITWKNCCTNHDSTAIFWKLAQESLHSTTLLCTHSLRAVRQI